MSMEPWRVGEARPLLCSQPQLPQPWFASRQHMGSPDPRSWSFQRSAAIVSFTTGLNPGHQRAAWAMCWSLGCTEQPTIRVTESTRVLRPVSPVSVQKTTRVVSTPNCTPGGLWPCLTDRCSWDGLTSKNADALAYSEADWTRWFGPLEFSVTPECSGRLFPSCPGQAFSKACLPGV